MTTATAPPPETKRWTLDEYHRMIQGGYLTEDDPVELLEGWIVYKMPKGTDHDLAIEDVRDELEPLLPKNWCVRTQSAITIKRGDSEPEPDAVVCTRKETRRGRHPFPADILIVIEVADSSLRTDRGQKQRIYASAGIPIYWIVNLNDRQIEVFTEPSGPSGRPKYAKKRIFRNGSKVPVVLNEKQVGEISAKLLLPR